MKTKYAVILSVLLLSFAVANDVFAYTWIKCSNGSRYKWPFAILTLHANTTSFLAGGQPRVALSAVNNSWNLGATRVLYTTKFDDILSARTNNQSEVWFSNIEPPGVAYLRVDSNCNIIEADVVFDTSVNYDYGITKAAFSSYGGARRPFRTTAMHEYGHAQGLTHTNTLYNIMGQDWTHIHANGTTAIAYPGEDAVNGSIATYGLGTTAYEDLSVVHWYRTGASGEYSVHSRTRALNAAGTAALPLKGNTTEPTHVIDKSVSLIFRLQMTYENLGKTTKTVKVGYYLSTDSTITTFDTFLGSGTVTVARNTPDTISNTTLALPATVQTNRYYWVGVIIDYNNAVAEKFESNNATYVPIFVTP